MLLFEAISSYMVLRKLFLKDRGDTLLQLLQIFWLKYKIITYFQCYLQVHFENMNIDIM